MGLTDQGIPIIGPLLNRIIGTRNERFVKKYTQRVNAINALEPAMRALSDEQIRAKVLEFRERLDKGEKSDDLMAEAFAAAREGMDRAVGIRNVFNPKLAFDAARLPEGARKLYEETRVKMEATPPAPPTGPYLGANRPLDGWELLDIPNEVYEAVRELYPESRPPFRARPFDVQLIGGMVLTQGKIAEMKTGEGKTIVAPLATYLACIERLKVHVVTVNDYLVQRDRDWTAPFFRALGLTVGAIHPQHQQDEGMKRQMYTCDVVYGTTSEFGFDYLRDNMKPTVEAQVQKKRQFAIVDEVDSILIDEARTPLIISGPAHEDQPRYDLADRIARHLVEKQKPWSGADEQVQDCKKRIKGCEGDIRQARDKGKVPALQEQLKQFRAELPGLEEARTKHEQYYEVQMERKSCHLTHDGTAEAQRFAGVGSFYVDQNIDLPHLVQQALRGHVVYEKDRDYVVMDSPDPMTQRPTPGVVIVDVFTGRPMIGRQWSDGLHQAVECKEKVPIKQETQTVATVTIQNFFKMYKRLAGMTGTADTEAQEFHDIYKLDVVGIPTNKSVTRQDSDDLVFLTGKDKWQFIVDEIKAFHDVGGPILVGTTSVEKSETLSKMLMSKHGIRHEVLNAKPEKIAREAEVVENAGQLGSVMIATNMAGRGTDIKLGRAAREQLLDHWLKRGLAPRTLTVDATTEQLREAVYRKIAPQYLEVQKREVDEIPYAELELRLLRAWASNHTWASPKAVESMSADELREELDKHGRFLLHRINWFDDVEDMGGLHVIGTERHEARRIDNQLRGRSGRQGDNGSSRFFVSLDDDLMKLFAGETTMKVLSRLGMKEGDAIEHPMLSKSVERAQRKVEERNFQYRKNVLEYDEVMEHQRQFFYGLRQRVLEGRDVKGLLLEYIEDTVSDAVGRFLDSDYPATCAAEFAKNVLDCSIQPDRLRGREREEIIDAILREAKFDARHTIGVTLGEYMPTEGSEVSVEFDAAGLISWAKTRFGVELDAAELRSGAADERSKIEGRLVAASIEKIDSADLSGLDAFLVRNYGAQQLANWVNEKFLLTLKPEDITGAAQGSNEGEKQGAVTAYLMEKARELYRKREVEYPVDFAIEMTMVLARQSLAEAMANLVGWANQRYQLGWTPEVIRTTPPPEIRKRLLEASQKFVADGVLDKEIAAAQACATDESLEKHFQGRFKQPLPENMRYLQMDERPDAIRSRVENLMRAELLYFERRILLDVLDDAWRNHLYAMDQLRDSINFRAFSQQDPRIEYKREGSHMFKSMLLGVKDKVTDYVFKARISPAAAAGPPPGMPMPARPPARPATAPALRAGNFSSSISGPGLEGGGTA